MSAIEEGHALVDPIPRPEIDQVEVKIKPAVREVFLLDNRKPNSLAILEGARDELRRRGVKVHDEIFRKPNAAVAIEGALLGQLSQVRGLLLSGVNDRGSCSSGGTLDSVLLQRAGVAAFVVLTKPFEAMAETVLAYYETDRRLPAVVLDHPTQNLSPEELPARSRQLADAAMRLLDGLED